MRKRLVFFGAGGLGRRALEETSEECVVIAFVDNSPDLWGAVIGGIKVFAPNELSGLVYDSIIITSQFFSEILQQLKSYNIPRQRIKIYNADFPPPVMPEPEPEKPVDPGYRKVLRLLLGDDLAEVPQWGSLPAERSVFTSLLRTIRPRCAIEVGTYLGGSLRVIHHFSEKVYSLDVDPTCEARLSSELPRAEFITGPSQQTLPSLLSRIANDPDHPPVDFVFLDGDHTRHGINGDIMGVLGHRFDHRMVVLMHDVANPECRQGILDAPWAKNPHVHYLDIDFVPGILHYLTSSYREMWGGFGIALFLPEKRTGRLKIRNDLSQQYDALYRGSVHVIEKSNPFAHHYQPFRSKPGGLPRFTAALPNYNHGAIIERAVRAMLEQTRPPDELLICDDASTDDSWEILHEISRLDASIRLLRNERNLGVVGTLNRLLSEAHGELVYFGGADDYVLPFFFENILTLLKRHEKTQLGMAAFHSIGENGSILSLNQVSRWQVPGYYTPRSCLQNYFAVEGPHHSLSSGTIYRRKALLDVGGFRSELGHWTDTFAIRVLCLKSGCVYTPKPGARFTVKNQSFSGKQHRDLDISLDIIESAAGLMRSQRFKHLFPEAHVTDWESRFRDLAYVLYKQTAGENQ
jgi:hypothetical protein